MTGTCGGPWPTPREPDRPDLDDDGRRLNLFQTLSIIAVLVGGVTWGAIYVQSLWGTYDAALARAVRAEARASAAEKALSLIIRSGDEGGITLARIDTRDMGEAEIIIRPRLGK